MSHILSSCWKWFFFFFFFLGVGLPLHIEYIFILNENCFTFPISSVDAYVCGIKCNYRNIFHSSFEKERTVTRQWGILAERTRADSEISLRDSTSFDWHDGQLWHNQLPCELSLTHVKGNSPSCVFLIKIKRPLWRKRAHPFAWPGK